MANENGETPIMKQYAAAKARYPKHLLFFRVGDFFELFYDDAKTISRALGLTLTARNKGPDPIPMAGVPAHAAEPYLARLLRMGFSVAICDQLELASETKGLVRREVTRVVTPGTVLEDNLLDARKPNRIAALIAGRALGSSGEEEDLYGLAVADLGTGSFYVQHVRGVAALRAEFMRLAPTEILLSEAPDERPPAPRGVNPFASLPLDGVAVSKLKPAAFDGTSALARLTQRFSENGRDRVAVAELKKLAKALPLAASAAGALTGYLEETYPGGKFRLLPPQPFDPLVFLTLSDSAIRSLELLETLRTRAFEGSLLWSIDRCCTPAGSRCLREWLIRPLRTKDALTRRQDAVATLLEHGPSRETVRTLCKRAADLERIGARLCAGKATPRDLVALKDTLLLLPELIAVVRHAAVGGSTLLEDPALYGAAPLPEEPAPGSCGSVLGEIQARLTNFDALAGIIAARLRDDCPNALHEGGLLRDGIDAELDRLRGVAAGGKGWIAQFQTDEVKRTGISSLKIGFNRVFGYYIEISHANKALVPTAYERRQTLTNAERFTTPDLKMREAEVLGAEEKINALERQLFLALRDEVAAEAPRLYAAGVALAELDALCSLAEVAHRRNHVRPELVENGALLIEQMRHPVLEELLPAGELVPNDLELTAGRVLRLTDSPPQIVILTGPNMAGKSTYIRCTALCVILAQMGAFVPAERAVIGLADRIFTRVGAADDLATGRSTFMVEMSEVAEILSGCTSDSLVILDEVGRGTSTYDGVSLAWALIEHLHEGACKPRTLFATHYHELAALQESLPRVSNASAAVREWQGEITFLHRIVAGPAERSFGIHAARLAGLPESVVARARDILQNLEAESLQHLPHDPQESGEPPAARAIETESQLATWSATRHRPRGDTTMDLFAVDEAHAPSPSKNEKNGGAKILEELARLQVERLTPVQALTKLEKLSERARKMGKA